jgi:hypothetical protein
VVHIAGDEQRWIAEFFAIVVDLLVGGLEALVLALVLSGEVIAEPDVCEAFASVDLGYGFSRCSVRLRRRLRLAEHFAEVNMDGLRVHLGHGGV